jgi:hypothetical protein
VPKRGAGESGLELVQRRSEPADVHVGVITALMIAWPLGASHRVPPNDFSLVRRDDVFRQGVTSPASACASWSRDLMLSFW